MKLIISSKNKGQKTILQKLLIAIAVVLFINLFVFFKGIILSS